MDGAMVLGRGRLDNALPSLVIQYHHPMSDHEQSLLQAVLSGDDEAWKRFVSAYAPFIYKAAARYSDDYDETMSIFTEILEKLRAGNGQRLRSFRGQSSLSTWLTVVARNLALDSLRRRYGRDFSGKRVRVVSYDADPACAGRLADPRDPAGEYNRREAEAASARILACLLPICRRLDPTPALLLQFVYFQGLRINEAGRLLGLPDVYKVLQKTLRRVKKELLAEAALPAAEVESFFSGDDA